MTLRNDEDNSAYKESKDWRKYFSALLVGKGLDIGPLHRPMVTHSDMAVTYVDQYPLKILRDYYPELADKEIIAPDVIDNAERLETFFPYTQDFVIAAHVIEHMRDPIRAVANWMRVLRKGGMLYLVIPDKRTNFDRNRVRTSLAHLIGDYEKPSLTRDEEHYIDYAIHVDGKEDGEEALEHARELEKRAYSIHFHVFLPKDVDKLLNWISNNVVPMRILEGPVMGRSDGEFHFLIEKI